MGDEEQGVAFVALQYDLLACHSSQFDTRGDGARGRGDSERGGGGGG